MSQINDITLKMKTLKITTEQGKNQSKRKLSKRKTNSYIDVSSPPPKKLRKTNKQQNNMRASVDDTSDDSYVEFSSSLSCWWFDFGCTKTPRLRSNSIDTINHSDYDQSTTTTTKDPLNLIAKAEQYAPIN